MCNHEVIGVVHRYHQSHAFPVVYVSSPMVSLNPPLSGMMSLSTGLHHATMISQNWKKPPNQTTIMPHGFPFDLDLFPPFLSCYPTECVSIRLDSFVPQCFLKPHDF
jgi:hypothetical protein